MKWKLTLLLSCFLVLVVSGIFLRKVGLHRVLINSSSPPVICTPEDQRALDTARVDLEAWHERVRKAEASLYNQNDHNPVNVEGYQLYLRVQEGVDKGCI